MDGANRARQSLLFRGRRRNSDVTDGPRQLVGNETSSGLSPEPRGQLEIALIADLYKVESDAEARDILGTPECLELRQSKNARIVRSIWKWVDARNGKHSPKSKMAKALTYATKQRAHLERFLYDPKLQPDNNAAERALRIVALGRKRSLFAGSAEHAQNLATLHSIVATCRLHHVNSYEYIRDVLIRIQSHPASRIEELMPWRWKRPKE